MSALVLVAYFLIGSIIAIWITRAIPKGNIRIAARTLGIIIVLWAPFWSKFGGKQIFDFKCKNFGGERIYNTVQANGYLNARYEPKGTNSMFHGSFKQAIKDLIEMRIHFFETLSPSKGGYYRFSLQSSDYPSCHWYSQAYRFKNFLTNLGLPVSQCLAREYVNEILSEYEVNSTSKHHTLGKARTWIESRDNGSTIAEYTSYILNDPLNFASGRAATCPNPIQSKKILSLTERVFQKWQK